MRTSEIEGRPLWPLAFEGQSGSKDQLTRPRLAFAAFTKTERRLSIRGANDVSQKQVMSRSASGSP